MQGTGMQALGSLFRASGLVQTQTGTGQNELAGRASDRFREPATGRMRWVPTTQPTAVLNIFNGVEESTNWWRKGLVGGSRKLSDPPDGPDSIGTAAASAMLVLAVACNG